MNGIAHNPEAIRYAYLGPIVSNQVERIKFSFSRNVAPSYVPDLLLEKAFEWTKKGVEELMLRPAVDLNLLIQLQQEIQDQFELRIALFWSQALFLYKTKLIVTYFNGTDAQVGVPGLGAGESRGQFACAHMATNPALRVVANYKGEIAALGQNSFLHLNANITAWLPKVVNDVDCLLDLHSSIHGRTFRFITTQILFSVSVESLSPLDGLKWFLYYSDLHLKECYQKSPSQEGKYVAWLYYNVVSAFCQMIHEEQDLPFSGYDVIHDEEICMQAQAIMHQAFIWEMQTLKPNMIAPTERALSFIHFDEIATKMRCFLDPIRFRLVGAVDAHATRCASSANVRQAALNFFASMESLEEFDFELQALDKKQLTYRALQLNAAIKEALTTTRPHNYYNIVLKILELCAVGP